MVGCSAAVTVLELASSASSSALGVRGDSTGCTRTNAVDRVPRRRRRGKAGAAGAVPLFPAQAEALVPTSVSHLGSDREARDQPSSGGVLELFRDPVAVFEAVFLAVLVAWIGWYGGAYVFKPPG